MIMNRIRNVCSYFLMITLIIPSSYFVHAQLFLQSFPSFVEAPKIWNNTPSDSFYVSRFASTVSPILAEGTFVCGLHCSRDMDNCLFGISILNTSRFEYPQLVWSANRNDPVDHKAVLKLTSEGELILKDANDTLVWSAYSEGSSVSRLSLSAEGNLMMLNRTNHIVWQSFDNPTDSLVRGQMLVAGQELRASVSPQNSSEGLYVFGIIDGLFSSSIYPDPSQTNYQYDYPQVVWSANRNNPVDHQARLKLTSEGELILTDGNDTRVWSTGKANHSVSRLILSAEGNLMLLNQTNHIVWQSFDHPTDSLVRGQKLVSGQKLRASESLYAFGIINGRFSAYMDTDPSQIYYKDYYNSSQYYTAEFQTGRLGDLYMPNSTMFIRFESDGHLRAYDWKSNDDKWDGTDILNLDRCSYPSACGTYGVCSEKACNCPDVVNTSETSYFKPINWASIDLGCNAISPVSCKLSHHHHHHHHHHHSFLQLPGEYFQGVYNFVFSDAIKVEDCKEACLKNCSCKAVIYRKGYCHFLSQVFSIKKIYAGDSDYSNSAFIKVRNPQGPSTNLSSSDSPPPKRQKAVVILGSTLGSIFGLFLVCIFIFLRIRKRFREVEEDYLDNMLGMPTRFSYEELRNATNSFSNKLGEGGFGSVFHGMLLPSGSQVAVKQIVGFGPVNKSFIAEVQTIGSIHHCNLVTLVGFCAENMKRLLVYEYMANGSLDRWIFNKNHDTSLGWKIRKKIILDIAKGLAYLHEECNQKIIHLDIKPQNILVDQNFNAKVSDFGLSKLIGKDQSQVFTAMRGTPGYMAPEWLSSVITEKVDVYSFGILVLEILCGRRNFDASQNEEDRHLVGVFRRKQEEGQVMELVDKFSDDMQSNAAEVVEMMKVSAWCLQTEYTRRPSMSTVVKLFEGSVDDAGNMNGDLLNGLLTPEATEMPASTILPSMLSGPR